VDSNGQNTDTYTANGGITRRLDGRNSISGEYSFSRFTYGEGSASTLGVLRINYSQANSLQASFKRHWTRRFSIAGSVGPQWISSSDSALLPSSTRFAVSASAQEAFKQGSASLFYTHGVTGGAGYLTGAENDTLSGNYSRAIGRNLNVGVTGSFLRTASLTASGAIHSEYGGVQASRGLGRFFSVFANYTVMNQSSSLLTSNLLNEPNILNTLTQVFGFGIGYTPRELRIKK